MGTVVGVAGIRSCRAVPRHWNQVEGQWLGPRLKFAPDKYQYMDENQQLKVGESQAKVMWRLGNGTACRVAYDPLDSSISRPAQLRVGGYFLIGAAVFCVLAGVVFLKMSL